MTNHETDGKNNGRSNALRSMRDKHDINIPKIVEFFPQKFGNEKPDWKVEKEKPKGKEKPIKKLEEKVQRKIVNY